LSRPFSTSLLHQQQEAVANAAEGANEEDNQVTEKKEKVKKRRYVDVETSMRYLQSKGTPFTSQNGYVDTGSVDSNRLMI